MIIPYIIKSGQRYNLPDGVGIAVTEERNGAYDLEMRYRYSGENADEIACESIIFAIAQKGIAPEPMRVYEVTTPIDGVMTVKAHHKSYDLDGYVLAAFSKPDITSIVSEINAQLTALGSDFTIVNNGLTGSKRITTNFPKSAASVIKEVIDTYGAEVSYQWDDNTGKETVTLNATRGVNSKATVGYGINLLSIDASVNSDNVYSAIYPYYAKESGGSWTIVTLPEETIATGATTTRQRTLPVDLTSAFNSTPTAAQLRAEANAYIAGTDWNATDSVTVDFVPLQNTTEYKNNIGDQALKLCDIVKVSANVLGVERTAKVVKTVYNQFTEKYDQMTVGTIPKNIADTIAELEAKQ